METENPDKVSRHEAGYTGEAGKRAEINKMRTSNNNKHGNPRWNTHLHSTYANPKSWASILPVKKDARFVHEAKSILPFFNLDHNECRPMDNQGSRKRMSVRIMCWKGSKNLARTSNVSLSCCNHTLTFNHNNAVVRGWDCSEWHLTLHWIRQAS